MICDFNLSNKFSDHHSVTLVDAVAWCRGETTEICGGSAVRRISASTTRATCCLWPCSASSRGHGPSPRRFSSETRSATSPTLTPTSRRRPPVSSPRRPPLRPSKVCTRVGGTGVRKEGLLGSCPLIAA